MYLVFDVGGTFIKYARMQGDGTIEEKGKFPTPNKSGQGVPDFVEAIGSIYDAYAAKEPIEGIAMGLPGQIDVERGIVYGGGGLKYLDTVPLAELLRERCNGVRIAMENDGKCAALAEVWKGNAKDCQDACVLVFGTGVGGGIVIDRKIHRGKRLLAGELSYCISNMSREDLTKIQPIEEIMGIEDSFDCMPFLVSATCSVSSLTHRVAKAKGLADPEVDGEKIYQWAAQGDEEVQEILEDEYFEIAKLCCNLYVELDPDVILIGGGISAQPAFLEGIQRYIDKMKVITKVYKELRIDVCKFRNDSNLLGALYHFQQQYMQTDAE